MKYLRTKYNEFKISIICKKLGIKNWSIRDGLVDVDDNVDLFRKGLIELPLKFGRVSGWFDCSYNKLTTLEGGPKEVGGDFDCCGNKLTTLEGGPSEVGGNFYCVSNQLTTLEGSPRKVGGNFYCSDNKLTTLEHFPKVSDRIYLGGNLLPKEIWYNIQHLKKIIEYGSEYDIWRDGKLYLPRFRDLMIDIKEGL